MPKSTKRCPKCGRTHPMRVLTCDCGAALPDATRVQGDGKSTGQALREVFTPWYLLNYMGVLLGQGIAGYLTVVLVGLSLDVFAPPMPDLPANTQLTSGDVVLILAFVVFTGILTSVGLYALRQVLFKRNITRQRLFWFVAFGAMWWLAIVAMLAGLFPAMELLTFNESNGGNLWPLLPLGLSLLIAAIPAALLVGREGD